jgi:hypothetical protein
MTHGTSPAGICCPQIPNFPSLPSRCCLQDTNSCAICLTNLEGNTTGNVASNHLKNMNRCKNNCFAAQTANLGGPETRLLFDNQ